MDGQAVQGLDTRERQWFIVGRWQEYEGEGRANLLRIVAVGAFYIVQLITYEILGHGTREFHIKVTALAVAWTMFALGIHLCLKRQIFPAALKFVSTATDIVLLTCVLIVANGPQSPLVVGYFLLIAIATLRFKLRLIWCATLGSMAGYLFLLGYVKWYRTEPGLRVERYEQLIVLVALALTGIVLGQVIRRVRYLADQFVRRVDAAAESAPTKG
jgi:hypothetical protein